LHAAPPYASRDVFFIHGIKEILLDTELDCSICREPLATTLRDIATTSLLRLPISNLVHVIMNKDAIGSTEKDVLNLDITAPDSSLQSQENSQLSTSTDKYSILGPAVRILPCKHIFGLQCLTAWFMSSITNCYPECNQVLFPERRLHLSLREPTRSIRSEFAAYVETICDDAETAKMIRENLMIEWTKALIREFAMKIWRQQGYEVEYEYVESGVIEEAMEDVEGV
jgi:hypothetical protein